MFNLLKIEAAEAERIAYSEGFTVAAELFARIAALEAERDALAAELEAERDALAAELEDARDDSLSRWERNNGPADAYKQFFYECFEHLAGRYPAADISSDYDQSVIFDAIARGEGTSE